MAMLAGTSQAIVLYDNGAVVNSSGLSILSAPATTLGITSSAVNKVGFRVTDTTLTNQQRTVFRINADIPNLTLPVGNYFFVWALEGTAAPGPFVPPVLGSLGVGNAYASQFGGRFEPLQDLGSRQSYDLPFSLNGTLLPVPEPGSLVLTLAGGLALVQVLRRRRSNQAAAAQG
jgi:hypothetical protein